MSTRMDKVAAALDHIFANPSLLEDALIHPGAKQPRAASRRVAYERLEFLGDRVLGLVVAEMLLKRFPDETEGDLARRHAWLVKGETAAKVAHSLGIDAALVVAGNADGTAAPTPAMLGDACEAVLGALYADAGLEPAARVVRRHWEPLMDQAVRPPKDAKTALQEWAQGAGLPLPAYETLGSEGPSHKPLFCVQASVQGFPSVRATGANKRAAEQAAAALLLETVS